MVAILLSINACAPTRVLDQRDGPGKPINASAIPDATPKPEPRSAYGNPKSYVVFGKRYYVMDSSENYVERGIASWYGAKFHGRWTSSGEPFNMYEITAAHKSLPLPTYVEITNLNNGKKIVAKVNDRGPFHGKRLIDLSYAAAAKLGIFAKGTGYVEVRALSPEKSPKQTTHQTYEEQVYIQLGAFEKKENAQRLQQKVMSLGVKNTRIYTSHQNSGLLHRVRIGPFPEPEKALSIMSQLAAAGIGDTHTITERRPVKS
ncbi:MAG TPA: septal ring lytic transglycosylase RlpA family lipoprotein [Gammaproteobacteria bacterium]|nr:septal ring lytic transglycosylase RlpA family lipoprotein [Gammaproteobacteria bacterium]